MAIEYHTSARFSLDDGKNRCVGYIQSHNGMDRSRVSLLQDGENKIEIPIDAIKSIQFTGKRERGSETLVQITLSSGRKLDGYFCSHAHYFIDDDGLQFDIGYGFYQGGKLTRLG
jgi:hypothetical protein